MRLSIIPVVKYQFECILRESVSQSQVLIFLTASSDIFSRNTRNSTWTWYGLNTDLVRIWFYHFNCPIYTLGEFMLPLFVDKYAQQWRGFSLFVSGNNTVTIWSERELIFS